MLQSAAWRGEASPGLVWLAGARRAKARTGFAGSPKNPAFFNRRGRR